MDTPVSRRDFVSACILGVEVTTNTPRGGDSGHGGRTVVRLIDVGSTDLHESRLVPSEFGGLDEVVLVLGGDAEAGVLADALIWAGRELKRQMEDNRTLDTVRWPDVTSAIVDEPF